MKRLLPLLLLFSASSFAHAEDLATTKQALHLISDFADDFCKTPPLEGGTKDVTLSIGAKSELNKVQKKVANLGISVHNTLVAPGRAEAGARGQEARSPSSSTAHDEGTISRMDSV